MKYIFFNLDGDFDMVVSHFAEAIGINYYDFGDSLNVLDECYGKISVFGVVIKIEKNSYGYEDKYKYMVSIHRDFTKKCKINNDVINSLIEIIAKMLVDNLSIDIAYEKDDSNGIEIYSR